MQVQAQVQSGPEQPRLQMQECPARVGVGWGELGMEMRWDVGWGWGCLRWQVKPGQVIASRQVRSRDTVVQTTAVQPTPVLSSYAQVRPRSSVQCGAAQCRPLVDLGMEHGGRRQGAICAGGWTINDRPLTATDMGGGWGWRGTKVKRLLWDWAHSGSGPGPGPGQGSGAMLRCQLPGATGAGAKLR